MLSGCISVPAAQYKPDNQLLPQVKKLTGWSTEYLRIGGKPARGCIACMKCFEKRNGRHFLTELAGEAPNDEIY